MDTADIENRFTHHAPDAKAVELHEVVRSRCKSLAHVLNDLLPEGRQKSLAITALEEVTMRANAAIAQR